MAKSNIYIAITLGLGVVISIPIWSFILPIWNAVTEQPLVDAKASAASYAVVFLSAVDFAAPALMALMIGVAISSAIATRLWDYVR